MGLISDPIRSDKISQRKQCKFLPAYPTYPTYNTYPTYLNKPPFISSFIPLSRHICLASYLNDGRNYLRAKRPTGETTHLMRANRPTPKPRAKRLRAKRPSETTHGRNDPDSFQTVVTKTELYSHRRELDH